MMKNASFLLPALLIPITAQAGFISVPEPGILPLLGVGIAAAVAARFLKKRK